MTDYRELIAEEQGTSLFDQELTKADVEIEEMATKMTEFCRNEGCQRSGGQICQSNVCGKCSSQLMYEDIAEYLYAAGYRKVDGNTSDGYHTFNELYHHRAILFAMICNQNSDIAWKSKKHNDGTMFDGMFIVGVETPQGQATYHYDISPYWDYFKVKELEAAPIWDGHTPSQAIDRIFEMSKNAAGYRKQSETVKEFAEKLIMYFSSQEIIVAAREHYAENDTLHSYFQGSRCTYSDAKQKVNEVAASFGEENDERR